MIKQVIVMRRDLHMRKGKIAAQAGHACVEAVLQTLEKNTLLSEEERENSALNRWLREGEAKICVYVDGEEALLELYHTLSEAEIMCALIQDAGHTEFHGQATYTCIATEPVEAERIDPYTGCLPLY